MEKIVEPHAPMPLTIGNTLHHGKYLINHVLGQTAIGMTFQGAQIQQNRPVILKVLQPNPDLSSDRDQLKQRFFDQVQQLAQCKHPGLVRLIDSFEEENAPIAVFDYTAGQTLLEVVHTKGALAESQAVQYIQQVGSALTELHNRGLIHRSVTPKNIIRPIGSDIVVLVNVGLLDSTVLGVATDSIQLPMGEYAAIEQHQTQLAHTSATDIYALAGTLYFLLTGYAPLAAPLRHRSPLPSPRQLCPNLTATVESAILRGLELNANSRPQTIAEWLALLPLSINPSDARKSNSVLNVSTVPQVATAPQVVNEIASEHSPLLAKSASLPTQRFSSQPNQSMTPSSLTLKSTFPKTLLATAAIAAAIGLGAGLILRITATSTGPGTSIFHTEQAFPPFENWPGAAPLVVPSSSYSSPPVEAPNQQEETDSRNQSESPVITQPPVEYEERTKPAVEEPAPSDLRPQDPVTNPTPPEIVPTPSSPTASESEVPPAVIPPPAPVEMKPEPEPPAPPLTSTPSSGDVQRQ
ncbi:serine/threonine protein kinase [Phormidium sp. CLA17]|uniref:serine/threonine protein kinase n=1 Tax=Leptolyngbya sp. Cla-17 TaxID=2803751 RepID=UPI001492A551|nr:serine/threonine-protein kinase [Leptolyngbya sp. Cla-17]MBM0740703.1 serine/threonine protein kinase [Leptolyngbya sp. Cla-17]